MEPLTDWVSVLPQMKLARSVPIVHRGEYGPGIVIRISDALVLVSFRRSSTSEQLLAFRRSGHDGLVTSGEERELRVDLSDEQGFGYALRRCVMLAEVNQNALNDLNNAWMRYSFAPGERGYQIRNLLAGRIPPSESDRLSLCEALVLIAAQPGVAL